MERLGQTWQSKQNEAQTNHPFSRARCCTRIALARPCMDIAARIRCQKKENNLNYVTTRVKFIGDLILMAKYFRFSFEIALDVIFLGGWGMLFSWLIVKDLRKSKHEKKYNDNI